MTTPLPLTTPTRAIIRIIARGEKVSRINYSRRMYAIIRRYTPEVAEVVPNECYAELAESILTDLKKEIGISFSIRISKADDFEKARMTSKKSKQISTYKEINSLFKGASFIPREDRTSIKHSLRAKRIRLSIPYLGKVA